ncbi:MAG: 2-phospho-L-lactate guanylyltransferase [Dehalococcoidia bacterium]|nr:2-phospho-L-lactate guanylyltransferase [Dehalococcoidia bacterium]
MKPTGTVAIVPMKPFALAKTRLSGALTPSQRMALSRNMLRRVLRAILAPHPGLQEDSRVGSVWVVGGDADAREVGSEEGAVWLEDDGSDVNDTVERAYHRGLESFMAALFIPRDLPFLGPRDVYDIIGASSHMKNITLAPASQDGGTNGILVPSGLPQPFHLMLGHNSFRSHLSQAASLGLPVAIYYSRGVALDLDTNEDLKAYERIEPGLLERLTEGEGG